MTLTASESVQGLVLAGGRSRRFIHGAKALEPLGNQPMIAHVLRRLLPQVEGAWISSGAGTLDLASLPEDLRELACLLDPEPRFRGPLAGLAAGLDALADRHQSESSAMAWLQLAPCDAPFLPRDLVARLLSEARQEDSGEVRVIVPRAEGHLQPTFAVWHVSTREAVQSALSKRGGAGLLDVLRQLPHQVVDWPATNPPAFFNVNTRADLDQAADWLQSATTTPSR